MNNYGSAMTEKNKTKNKINKAVGGKEGNKKT